MALIIEDGTGIENANSFVSDAELDAYLASFNKTFLDSSTIAEKEAIIIDAATFLSFSYNWRYAKSTELNDLPYPVDCSDLNTDEALKRFKKVQNHIILLNEGNLLTTIKQAANLKRQDIAEIEEEYFNNSSDNQVKSMPIIKRMLKDWIAQPNIEIILN
jgi:hypothetical protein